MAAGVAIKHKRKAGAFTSGQLQAGEVGVNTSADRLEFSTDGSDVVTVGEPCKRYVALLNQSGTDAPVATVLENGLSGTVVWEYVATGRYTATLSGAFPSGKTIIICDKVRYDTASSLEDRRAFACLRTSANVLTLFSGIETNPLDDMLIDYVFIVMVYP